jgi:hypothetical protein
MTNINIQTIYNKEDIGCSSFTEELTRSEREYAKNKLKINIKNEAYKKFPSLFSKK